MDPTACLQEILDAAETNDRDSYIEHCKALTNWLAFGGFKPKLSAVRDLRYIAGTGTSWSLMQPAEGSRYSKWTIVRWGHRGHPFVEAELS